MADDSDHEDDYNNDTHLCIKCNQTINGLDNYISHRKNKCRKNVQNNEVNATNKEKKLLVSENCESQIEKLTTENQSSSSIGISIPCEKNSSIYNKKIEIIDNEKNMGTHCDATTSSRAFTSPSITTTTLNDKPNFIVVCRCTTPPTRTITTTATSTPCTSSRKSTTSTTPRNTSSPTTSDFNKSISENYDINYELGADLFFSSLELQSSAKVKSSSSSSTTTSAAAGGGTTTGQISTNPINKKPQILTRKATAAIMAHHHHHHHHHHEHDQDIWINNTNSDEKLLKVVNDISGTKKIDDTVFALLPYSSQPSLRNPFDVVGDDDHHHHHHNRHQDQTQEDDDDDDDDDDDNDDDENDEEAEAEAEEEAEIEAEVQAETETETESEIETEEEEEEDGEKYPTHNRMNNEIASPNESEQEELEEESYQLIEIIDEENDNDVNENDQNENYYYLNDDGGRNVDNRNNDNHKVSEAENERNNEAEGDGNANDDDEEGDGDDDDDLDEEEERDDDEEDDEEDDDIDYRIPIKSHTGGKWKPSYIDNQQSRNQQQSLQEKQSENLASSKNNNWNTVNNQPHHHHHHHHQQQHQEDDIDEIHTSHHPPPMHTKGKWVPGTKIIKLDYKQDPEPEKIFTDQFWCSTCNRKLASRIVYERHLKSNLHLKRSQPEKELEKALRPVPRRPMPNINELCKRIITPSPYLNENIYTTNTDLQQSNQEQMDQRDLQAENSSLIGLTKAAEKLSSVIIINSKTNDVDEPTANNGRRTRRRIYIKCELCKSRMFTHRYGKHLISIYHYRFMLSSPENSFQCILNNIYDIVKQSPFQCHPCRFYANTEEMFFRHWNTKEHTDITEGPGRFWCNFCKFECEDNNQMRRHLVDEDHRDIVRLINRSVPIIIRKRTVLACTKCHQEFYLNMELRQHSLKCQSAAPAHGTASNDYQSKFVCGECQWICRSRLSLQKHTNKLHNKKMYFCGPCNLNFDTAVDAKRHRTTAKHKVESARLCNRRNKYLKRQCMICKEMQADILQLKEHLRIKHPEQNYSCTQCGKQFIFSQELSRHVRDKGCKNKIITVLDVPVTEGDKPAIETEEEIILSPQSITIMDSSLHSIDMIVDAQDEQEIINLWICQLCQFSTNSESEYLLHEILHKYNNSNFLDKLPCSRCPKSFLKTSLRYHLRKHTNERLYQCDQCSLGFIRKSNLRYHVERLHGVKNDTGVNIPTPYVKRNTTKLHSSNCIVHTCKVCKKEFRTSYLLDQHMHCHRNVIDVKSFPCTVENCIFSGRSAAAVRDHMLSHTNEKLFHCLYEDCKYGGKSMSLLKRHIKFQHEIPRRRQQHQQQKQLQKQQPHEENKEEETDDEEETEQSNNFPEFPKQLQCKHCDFRTTISSHFKRHQRIHTGEKPYSCPYCEYTCNSSENLRKHVLRTNLHVGRYLYECKYCPDPITRFVTNNSKFYLGHLRNVHPKESIN